ncbi:relaxase domain-containing protein [Iamia sp. SCSIO 61187]|uniref:MobF family relaxase n=1 Tax=Iamia sp. SCSIO 61187 TaxID=2722752 RepID=UPI001C62E794|nr:MobF family relaxase [Iamia sp. SCSIO 61187]QYG91000.1 relaxase domain-containing protein [Iamia sp. SCSIO 61187]
MMRVTTLKAAGDRLGGLLAYYAGLAEDRQRPGPPRGPVEYYLDPDEPAGRWWGRGRHALGLDGEVSGEDLRAVLEGHHPRSGARLGRRFGDSSARGFDATFSAPKSVSVLWALTPDQWVRAEVLAAHDAAVDAALAYLERHGAVTRRGTDGIDQVDTLGLTVALFRQHTSRTMDPQLHTHAVIATKIQDPTGRWLSLDARFLKQQQRTIGWVYDAALRSELTARLGLGWEPLDGGQADTTCVPESVRDLFSARSAQVESKLSDLLRAWTDEHDGADPDPRTIAQLERRAALASRPAKAHGIDGTNLHQTWREQAAAVGFDPDGLTSEGVGSPIDAPILSDDELIAEALRRISQEASTWLRADLTRHLATLIAPNDLTGSEAVKRIDRLATSADTQCVPLGPPTEPGAPRRRDGRPVTEAVTDRRLTTRAVLDQETALQRWAAASSAPVGPAPDPQRGASDAMASHQPLVLVVGPAGTGKTTTTARAVRILQHQRRPVVALAPSGKAADVLGLEAGCPTETLAAFLTRHQQRTSTPWAPCTTVVVDEAGMAATDDLHSLVTLAQRHRWRLVAIGDPHQLPAVGRGGVFAHWTATLPAHHLQTPRRFEEEWEAGASLGLRNGEPAAAAEYELHGRLKTVHPTLAAARVAAIHRRYEDAGRTVAITTNTAETARRINVEIQRQANPRPGRGRVALADGTRAGPGDRIATRRNQPSLQTTDGQQVRNRHTWTVESAEPGGSLTVAHPDRGAVRLPAEYVVEHVELGWAVTGYGNQGDTVEIGLAVLEPGTTRNHTYVAMTRGRHTNLAFLTDPTGTAHAGDLLTSIIERTPRHDSALAIDDALHRQAARAAPTRSEVPPVTPPAPDRIDQIRAKLDRLRRRPSPDRSRGL